LKKSILIVTEYFYPEEFKINEIALSWKKKGYIVDVLTTVPTYPESRIYNGYKNKFYQKENWQNINIYRVKAITGYKTSLIKKLLKYFSFMFFASFISLKIGKKYDYIFGFNIASLTSMIPAILINKKYNKPVTLWVQDVWPDSVYAYGFKKRKILNFCLNKTIKYIYKYTTNFAISGKGFKDKIIPYIDTNKQIKYLPNWADNLDMDIETMLLGENNKIHFTFAGNIGKVQNLENIIKGFDILPNTYKDKVQLNIVGDGSALNELKKIAISKNIIFHGRKPREHMSKYYKGSDFLIVSLIDKDIFRVTVPAKTQTYIKAKKPILAIINGDTRDIIEYYNLGYTTNPNDIKEISNIFIKALKTDEATIKKFISNCEKLTNTVFDKNKIIDELLNLTIGKIDD